MKGDTDYTYLAYRFNNKMDLNPTTIGFSDESDAQNEVVLEEFDEYEEAYDDRDLAAVAEEMADVLVTIFIQAHRMGIDIDSAYEAKMNYNLQKTGERNEDGKVVDDAELEKPDFSRFTDGFNY